MQSRGKLHLNFDKSHLEGVPSQDVWKVWPEVKTLIGPAVETMGTHGVEDVHKLIMDRDWQLWISRGKTIEAACITQINDLPKIKICRIVLVAGTNMDSWLHFEEHIAEWAKSQGCKKLVGELRKGWQRKLKHWIFGNIVAERKI